MTRKKSAMIGSDSNTLVDSFQRKVSYLRLSVTDRCNLRCRYCAPSMPSPKPMDALLSMEEMHRLVRVGVGLGINKVRLTGGEPLCRPGIDSFIEKLYALPQIRDVSITTNATMLSDHVKDLKRAGLRRINISLDTLDRDKFRQLTGADQFHNVWGGIMAAAEAGFDPVKINTVVMKGFNDDEVERLAELALRYPFHIRFIEYMPIGTDPTAAQRYFVSVTEIKERLDRVGKLQPIDKGPNDGPAQRYRFEQGRGEVGLIGSMSAHFCKTCNRLRLTSDGFLRACLLADDQLNVMGPMRAGATDEELKALFIQTINNKKDRHHMNFSGGRRLQTKMVSIGG